MSLEEKLEAMRKEMHAAIEDAAEKAGREKAEALRKTKEQVDGKRGKILSAAKAEADEITLKTTQKDLDSIVGKLIGKYLEE